MQTWNVGMYGVASRTSDHVLGHHVWHSAVPDAPGREAMSARKTMFSCGTPWSSSTRMAMKAAAPVAMVASSSRIWLCATVGGKLR